MSPLLGAALHPVWREAPQSPATSYVSVHAPPQADVDVAIIGAGLSGLWTAYYLRKALPSLRIALLEAHEVGFGASGRNGGWCSGFFPSTIDEIAHSHGPQAALLAYRESFATLAEVAGVLRTENIECAWHQGGTVQSATTPLQAKRLQHGLAAQHAAGLSNEDVTWLSPDRVSEHLTVAETYGAIYSPHCATVNPLQLVRGLANVLRRNNVSLWENTIVSAVDDGRIVHQHGICSAELVVQATEGYSHSIRQTRRRVVPLYSLMVATEPLDAPTLANIGWHNRATFNDASQMIIYAQLTADHRIAFGGRGAPYHFGSRIKERFDIDDDTHQHIVKSIARHFPAAAHARITHRWGGPLAVPRDWTPTVIMNREQRYARIGGYTGDGVAATNLFARTLVDLYLERDTPLTHLPFINHQSPRWEIEPLRFLGINSLIALSNSIDNHEATHGKSPRIRTRLLEALL